MTTVPRPRYTAVGYLLKDCTSRLNAGDYLASYCDYEDTTRLSTHVYIYKVEPDLKLKAIFAVDDWETDDEHAVDAAIEPWVSSEVGVALTHDEFEGLQMLMTLIGDDDINARMWAMRNHLAALIGEDRRDPPPT